MMEILIFDLILTISGFSSARSKILTIPLEGIKQVNIWIK